MQNLKDNIVSELITAPLTLTASFQNVGERLNVGDINFLSLWADLTINDSTLPQFKVVAFKTPDSVDGFDLPIHIVESGKVSVSSQVFELASANAKIAIGLTSSDVITFIQIQAKVATVGATAATLNTCAILGSLAGK